MSTQPLLLLYDIHYLARGGEGAVRTGIGRACLGILNALRLRDDVRIELISTAGFEEQAAELIHCTPECAGLPLLRFEMPSEKRSPLATLKDKMIQCALTQGKQLANHYAPHLSRKLFKRFVSYHELSEKETLRRRNILSEHYAGKQAWFFSIYDAIPEYMLHVPELHTSIMVQDIIPLRLPEYRSVAEAFISLMQHGAFRSDVILTNSDFTRNDLLSFFPQIPAEKVRTTLLGCDSRFSPSSESDIAAVRARFGIPDGYQYIHVLSSLEPRKRVLHIVSCFNACLQRNELKNVLLIISGGQGWRYQPVFCEARKNKDKILFTGSICDAEIIALLGGCSCFVFMSEYEGVGLPVVEAMACGAPVIAARSTSLPEVAGDAAMLVDPSDNAALESALILLCGDAELRASMRSRSLTRARTLTWKQTAASLVAALHESAFDPDTPTYRTDSTTE